MFKKIIENYATRRFVYVAEWWRHLSSRIQTASLFVPRRCRERR